MILLLLASALASQVDLNTASVAELDALPGIGRAKARAIVDHRQRHGPFTGLEDLARVSGIGPGTRAALHGRVRFGASVLATGTSQPRSQEARIPVVPSVVDVDINRATVEKIAGLPGISGARAEAIVQDRERNGPFAECADLVRVEGVGPATVAALRGLCITRSQTTVERGERSSNR